ncbi:AAA family ATPase [Neoaquamicrobium sediminum]|uniref:AAA family ATPase n=1 Tax=Neoaquamicrobium sediminum TaxID=1849104 RepID=UPI003BAC1590
MRIRYAVNNLRRLIAVPRIEIRPLTILLGRNSAGKSTFLRSISLLRQSIETNSSAPILWYGNYVDFGNYKSAVSDNDVSNEITFSFGIDNFNKYTNRQNYLGIRKDVVIPQAVQYGNILIDYIIGGDGDSTYRSEIRLEVKEIDTVLEIEFGSRKPFVSNIKINGDTFKVIPDNYRIFIPNNELFGRPTFFAVGKDESLNFEHIRDVFRGAIEKEIGNIDARVGRHRITKEADRILNQRSLSPAALKELSKADTQTFRQFYTSLPQRWRSPKLKKLDEICRVHHSFEVLDALSFSLNSLFRSVEYIGPARARSERFYRQQELEVSEISPDGRNLPMFLASLDPFTLSSFSSWVERVFGYGVSVQKNEGHISINLEQAGKSVNVLDTGYGVSQILPVLTQIWWMQQPDRYRRRSVSANRLDVKTLLIEQPELHLHPAHQALIADVFVDALKNESAPVSFVVETHSESLINRLGELVSLGLVSADDVQIAIFGDDQNGEGQQVAISTFGPDGVLQNWPHGFFNY